MIILDTNVVSEPMKPNGNPAVTAWLDRQAAETLYLTAISLSELLTGIEMLPGGKRKEGLDALLTELMARLFAERILPFDQKAAVAHARFASQARARGRVLSVADGQIAAIAHVYGFTVATRDTEPFVAAGVPVINPWEADQS
jgi:predicted nucleic acid-binding protein